jgi:hypothetical protein
MIKYQLTCDKDHAFEAWYPSAHAYDRLRGAGHVTCAICGSTTVQKAMMAPNVRPGRSQAERPKLPEPKSEFEAAFAEMRRQVEANSEYVGLNFSTEARRMHEGDAPERSIYGEAKWEEARAMLEDGIAVAPLPFMPRRQVN